MRILFAGNPPIAQTALAALSSLERETGGSACTLAGLLTGPDAVKGRGRELTPSALSLAASALSAERERAGFPAIEQFKYARPDAEAAARIAAKGFDILVCFAYGALFPQDFLALFPWGGVNIHPSLLPRHRGPSPIQAAILCRDAETGVSVQRVAAKMDTGEILAQTRIPLRGNETSASLGEEVARQSGPLIKSVIQGLRGGTVRGRPQAEAGVTYCAKITRACARIDWRADAALIDARVRAFSPAPPCWTEDAGRILNILEGSVFSATIEGGPGTDAPGAVAGVDGTAGLLIRCGGGSLYGARVLQYQTKKALDFRSFLNGNRAITGRRLGAGRD